MDSKVLVFDPESPELLPVRRKRRLRDITRRAEKNLAFGFDHMFGHDSTNHQVFEESTKCMLDGLLGGYNCSVFAYGATGAGKTFTMLGSGSQPGVIYHTMTALYQRKHALAGEKTCDVSISYMEVYNEKIKDLLAESKPLPIREDPARYRNFRGSC